MTQRLYHGDSTLLEFDATVVAILENRIVLNHTAFYPESGGQLADHGVLMVSNGAGPMAEMALRITDVQESESGEILHFAAGEIPSVGARVRGRVDAARRRDHSQQHSGGHLLSAAFLATTNAPTLSFHMGDESCTLDLDMQSITQQELNEVAALANRVVMENREITVRWVLPDDARAMGVRKIPPDLKGALRIVEMGSFDLNACGGTHVPRTGNIGPILLRKIEKVRQGVRVEFVCGDRAVAAAQRDYEALTQAAAVYSTHVWEVGRHVRKSLDEVKAAQKECKKLLEQLAEFHAEKLLQEAPRQGELRWVQRVFPDRDLPAVKLLAQKMIRYPNAVVLIACGQGRPSVVLAQSAGGPFDMGRLIRDAAAELSLRGGGDHDLAQAVVREGTELEKLLANFADRMSANGGQPTLVLSRCSQASTAQANDCARGTAA